MNEQEIRAMLQATGEEITDPDGSVIGYVSQPARFRVNRPYLARGGFLVVHRDQESGHYIGTEFDALPHPTTGEGYPAGYSQLVFKAVSLAEALRRVMAYLADADVQ